MTITDIAASEAAPRPGIGARRDYHALNAQLNLYAADGSIQFGKDEEAVAAYLEQYVVPRTRRFPSVRERLAWLVANEYYEAEYLEVYEPEFLEALHDRASAAGHRFASFLGAFKFFSSYALTSFDGEAILEGFEERVVATALYLARGDAGLATELVDEMLSGRFQPATPTFLNAGKRQRGELVSCFLLRLEDNLESIGRGVNSALQLSKRGGGVALLLTNLRETGAPIKRIENQSSGVVPVMKILEDSFSYANQLGARQGAGAVYLHAHHPDIMRFLDTKRENADEKIRIKTLSLGVVIPDVTFELARENREMHLFSPYDVEREYGVPFSDLSVNDRYEELVANPRIRKTVLSAREFFRTLAELQFESGYPYVLFEDTVNRANPLEGRVNMSNLCSEILQVNTPSEYDVAIGYERVGHDISCNLGSMNIAAAMASGDLGATVETAVRALSNVSDLTEVDAVPSVAAGNRASHAIGLGQMNLHGYLGSQRIRYGSAEGIDFTDFYFLTVTYHAVRASNRIAMERGERFEGFDRSAYADGSYFDRYTAEDRRPATQRVTELFADAGVAIPSRQEWIELRESVRRHGIYNAYLQAVPPTGSISYVNHSTSSIHPIAARVEIRKEGKLGRVYYPAPHMTDDNQEFFEDAYEIGPEKIIDTYAAATQHVDQGLSLTLFFTDTATTRDINKAQIYAWRRGIKSLYYIRLRQLALTGTEIEGCVSCAL
ncbi:ribonucleotide-diphosphate reductase subunit alpha [Leucobacter sp. OLJS4]|uniref:class 1b ribonucleoside-diphosphate reductase subunit alpha n=1 Tax=unclassified Leucobacter TaxID=2621730 RepID=UPI000C180492|nr:MULTISPECIES: class 1b ribonucleoside-diphosphate reductase subunit alpha [unclassified Leucobacter]PIJ50680.1 ribonucleotide-diphosphate reductase subunit alpha [Leucobacter sp. OLES1]PII81379.1 ribonucleotide-diphosphate reductase subunit alpha [Leucobacter sp. OLCALW19]PII86047.1 ribonucleotide-diphosphate reductase subunit alpha [Leucobacter sp. OLTLW20]PII89943.1 ribonucleotide-diphosphate reductase subunit alpha [Leucobacter sp. OLAS13]PII96974.1 ribonucleotide-diphosphate reductase s